MLFMRAATKQEVDYACINYHYAKKTPVYTYAYSFFFDERFCGVITFGNANRYAGTRFNLANGECAELNRCAFNGKQGITSKCISLALKQLKRDAKHIKLVVSYADERHDHIGTIYQASNWYYDGVSFQPNSEYILNGKMVRRSSVQHIDRSKIRTISKVKTYNKHRYYYPLCDSIKDKLELIKKKYPKTLTTK